MIFDQIDKKLFLLLQISTKKTTIKLSAIINFSIISDYERIKKL